MGEVWQYHMKKWGSKKTDIRPNEGSFLNPTELKHSRKIAHTYNGDIYIVPEVDLLHVGKKKIIAKVFQSCDQAEKQDEVITEIFNDLYNLERIENKMDKNYSRNCEMLYLLHPGYKEEHFYFFGHRGRYIFTSDGKLSEFYMYAGIQTHDIAPLTDFIEHFEYRESMLKEIIFELLQGLGKMCNGDYVYRSIRLETILVLNHYNHFEITFLPFDATSVHKRESFFDDHRRHRDALLPRIMEDLKFIPPEVEEENTYSSKSDFWLFGIAIIEMLVAWKQVDNVEQLLDPKSRKQANINEDLKDFLERCFNVKEVDAWNNLAWELERHPFLQFKSMRNDMLYYAKILMHHHERVVLLSNERQYLQNLESMAFIEQQERKRPILSNLLNQQYNIFEHAEKLYKFHKSIFYPHLLHTNLHDIELEVCFLSHEPVMADLYMDFYETVESTLVAIWELKENKEFLHYSTGSSDDIFNDFHRMIILFQEDDQSNNFSFPELQDTHGIEYLLKLMESLLMQPLKQLDGYADQMLLGTERYPLELHCRDTVTQLRKKIQKYVKTSVPFIGLPMDVRAPKHGSNIYIITAICPGETTAQEKALFVTDNNVMICSNVSDYYILNYLFPLPEIRITHTSEDSEEFNLSTRKSGHSILIQKITDAEGRRNLKKKCFEEIYGQQCEIKREKSESEKMKLFGRSLEELAQEAYDPVPIIVRVMVYELQPMNDHDTVDMCEVFAATGPARVPELKASFQKAYATGNPTIKINSKKSVFQLLALLKHFLISLPEPLLALKLCEEFAGSFQINKFEFANDDNQIAMLRGLINSTLVLSHLRTLNVFLRFLEKKSAGREEKNLKKLYLAVHPILFGLNNKTECGCDLFAFSDNPHRCSLCLAGATITRLLINNRKIILWRHMQVSDQQKIDNILCSKVYISKRPTPIPQHYYCLTFVLKKPKKGYRNYRGWIYLHFNGENIARQLQLHPEEQPRIYVAGADNKFMCKIDHTDFLQKMKNRKMLTLSCGDFNSTWRKYGGDAYFKKIRHHSKVAVHFSN